MTTERAEHYRITVGEYASQRGANFGMFSIPNAKSNKAMVVICAPTTEMWQHVSVSMRNQTPNWDDMCKVKDLFWDKDELVIQYHPKEKDYVNMHPHCLHLWSSKQIEIPTPPKILIGW